MLSRKGVPRVVWQRARKPLNGEDSLDGTPALFDAMPFLNLARSLGDFWSFSPTTKEFAVSPCPDVHIHPLNLQVQKFVVVASDGLWNVMTPQQVVEFIWDYENDDQTSHQPRDVVKAVINEALRRWKAKNLPADNIAVLIAFLSECVVTVSDNSDNSPAVSKDETRMATSSSTKSNYRNYKKTTAHAAPWKFTTNLSPSTEDSSSLSRTSLGKRLAKDDCDEIVPLKRGRLDNVDSGLDMDSHTDTTENP